MLERQAARRQRRIARRSARSRRWSELRRSRRRLDAIRLRSAADAGRGHRAHRAGRLQGRRRRSPGTCPSRSTPAPRRPMGVGLRAGDAPAPSRGRPATCTAHRPDAAGGSARAGGPRHVRLLRPLLDGELPAARPQPPPRSTPASRTTGYGQIPDDPGSTARGCILALPAPRGLGVGRPLDRRPGPPDHRGRRAARAARAVRLVRRRSAESLGMNVIAARARAPAATVVKALQDNEVVCLLCDRDIQGGGIEVEFFGERTTLPAGPATLAFRTGAPILPTAVYFTERRNGHLADVRPPVPMERTRRAARRRRPGHAGPHRRAGGPHPRRARPVAPVPAQLARRRRPRRLTRRVLTT